jgi:hypothetical protein
MANESISWKTETQVEVEVATSYHNERGRKTILVCVDGDSFPLTPGDAKKLAAALNELSESK